VGFSRRKIPRCGAGRWQRAEIVKFVKSAKSVKISLKSVHYF